MPGFQLSWPQRGLCHVKLAGAGQDLVRYLSWVKIVEAVTELSVGTVLFYNADYRSASHTVNIYAHRDPRTQRQPYSDERVMPRRQSRLSSRPVQQAQQPEASTSASIPIVKTRPLPAYRRKDADGGLGEKPAPEEQVILHCLCSLRINRQCTPGSSCHLF